MAGRVAIHQHDDGSAYVVVQLIGEVDLATDSATRALLHGAFTSATAAHAPVIIDCSQVTFLALAGIRALLEAKQRHGQASQLRLVGASGGPVDRMVDLLGLNDAFTVYPTVSAAL